ncbi:MAG: AbrB/MazE/SpoVT family DNA-binding domain-containing protein [Nitrososphaerales archaeon]
MSEKGQVTIPKQIRDALGLKKGDRMVFLDGGDGRQVVLRKAKPGRLSETLRSQKPWGEGGGGLELQRRLRKEWG